MTQEMIFNYLKETFGDIGIVFSKEEVGDSWLSVPPEQLPVIARFLRDDKELRFNSLMCLTGVHYPAESQLGVTYHLHSTVLRHSLVCKIKVPEDNPVVPTVENIWKTANWHEREAMDMLGIYFEDHPNMKRILCPDDWEGHPLRKDYSPQGFYNGLTTSI